jgi:transcriptional regulator with XRE-family HTH domain
MLRDGLQNESAYTWRVTRTFAQHLQALRDAAGLSQETLAHKMGLKRPSVIQSWEKARRLPRARSLPRLAKALGADEATLVPVYLSPPELRLLTVFETVPPEERENAVRDFVATTELLRHDVTKRSAPQSGVATKVGAHAGRRGRLKG